MSNNAKTKKPLSDAEKAKANLARAMSSEGQDSPYLQEEIVEESAIDELPHSELPEVSFSKPVDLKPSDQGNIDIQGLLKELTPTSQVVLQTIEEYINEMSPNRLITTEKGVMYQKRFSKALSTLFNQVPDQDFNKLYKTVLNLFNEHQNGALGESYVYRFAENWEMAEKERAFFRRLVNVMLVTRDVKTRRSAFKELRTAYSFEFGLTQAAKNRLTNFYSD